MHTTPTLLAAGTLLLALTPSAQAGPGSLVYDPLAALGDYVVECVDGRCSHPFSGDNCDREAIGNACDLRKSVSGFCDGDCRVGDPTMDRDHDLVPDTLESTYCGRRAVAGVDAQVKTFATRCESGGDVSGLADLDRDGLPDLLEPLLCSVEDQASGLDGSCDPAGKDYTL